MTPKNQGLETKVAFHIQVMRASAPLRLRLGLVPRCRCSLVIHKPFTTDITSVFFEALGKWVLLWPEVGPG